MRLRAALTLFIFFAVPLNALALTQSSVQSWTDVTLCRVLVDLGNSYSNDKKLVQSEIRRRSINCNTSKSTKKTSFLNTYNKNDLKNCLSGFGVLGTIVGGTKGWSNCYGELDFKYENTTPQFKNDRYYGEFQKGVYSGYGVYFYNGNSPYKGAIYKGQWRNGQSNGQGELTLSSGNVIRASFTNGLASGAGSIEYINGSLYEGNIRNNLPNGEGVFTSLDGGATVTVWVNGKPGSRVEYRYANGDYYSGYQKNNIPTGLGKLVKKSKVVFDGLWDAGIFLGPELSGNLNLGM